VVERKERGDSEATRMCSGTGGNRTHAPLARTPLSAPIEHIIYCHIGRNPGDHTSSVCPCSYVRGECTAAVWSGCSVAGTPLRSAAAPPSSSKFKLGSGTARSRICRIAAPLGVHWCRGTVGHCKLEPRWNLPPKLEGPAPGPGRLSLARSLARQRRIVLFESTSQIRPLDNGTSGVLGSG
jgi:hypothetical protein